jgi:hypothetical protein
MAVLHKKTDEGNRAADDAGPSCPTAGRARGLTRGGPLAVAVSVRRQTPSEERRFGAALQLLLSELVRQPTGRAGDVHD